ncbi:hypothetical protein KR093_007716, partial [Drosophila rubida]
SLMDISSSSDMPNYCDKPQQSHHRQGDIERIVLRTLEELKYKCSFKDVDELKLMRLIVPKVLRELQVHEQLQEELQSIKQTLNSYIQHSKTVSEDIAEIFLDLHNIYSKLEKLDKADKRERKLKQDKKFMKRIREAEDYLESKKHYIANDVAEFAGSSIKAPFATSSQSDEASTCETRHAEKR